MADDSGERSTGWEDWLRRHGGNPSRPEPVEDYVKRKEREEVLWRVAHRADEWVHWPSDEARERRILGAEYDGRLRQMEADEQRGWRSVAVDSAVQWVRTQLCRLHPRRNRSEKG